MATENELKSLSRKKQSPVDIRDEDVECIRLPPLTLIGHWLNDGEAFLINDGHRAVIELAGERIPSILKCGPLKNDEFEFHDAHFHWGEDDCCGSEHTINGTWFSMEAHVVHWNRKYGTFEECLKYEDGICVLAYLFLVREYPCDSETPMIMDKITKNLKDVMKAGSKTEIAANSLYWMRAAIFSKSYYFYKGSYNHGNFPECAYWIVFPNVLSIRSDQVAEFRRLRNEKGKKMLANWRKTQPLNDRKIYKVCS